MYTTGSQAALETYGIKIAVTLPRLRAALSGQRPLFHMVNNENVPGLMIQREVLSPLEANARGLLKGVEGSYGMARRLPRDNDITVNSDWLGASVPAEEIFSAYDQPYRAGAHAAASLPGVQGEYAQRSALSANISRYPNKNGPTISFDESAPRTDYGSVGMMTSPANVMGSLSRSPGEVKALPTWSKGPDGLVEKANLPTASGQLIYDPKTTPRELALKLKAEHAIPLNARFHRRLRAYQKQTAPLEMSSSADVERGNASADMYPPEFQTLLAKAKPRYPEE